MNSMKKGILRLVIALVFVCLPSVVASASEVVGSYLYATVYNSSSACAIQTTTEYATTSGTYYSKGQVRMYNGNGYANYNTTQSPYIQGRTVNRLEDIYNINENNEVYGSELFLSEYNITPDLILAEGNNGKTGYVRYEDLNEEIPDNLGEAIEYQNNLPDSRQIPLYASDGLTVIDSFTIYYNCVEEH